MKLYRLEHKGSGYGPYTVLGVDSRLSDHYGEKANSPEMSFFLSLFRKYCFAADLPDVEDDVKGFYMGLLCATTSLEKLHDWFGGVNMRRWPKFDFTIFEIEIEDEHVEIGKHQVAYRPDKVTAKREIPITRELVWEMR